MGRLYIVTCPMNHEEQGDGIALMLIHGFPHDHTLWRPQLEGFSGMAGVIAPDLPGFGRAEDVPPTMTMDDYARDIKALLDRLGIERAVVGGISMGGYVALAFATLFPDTLDGLILCHTRSGGDTEQMRKARHVTAGRVMSEGMDGLAREMAPRMFSEHSMREHPELVPFLHGMIARQSPAATAAAARGMALRPDRTPMLPSISVPVLIITGSADTLIPPSESEAMAAMIPGSELVVIPDVGHLSNLEDAQAFNGAVRNFLQRVN